MAASKWEQRLLFEFQSMPSEVLLEQLSRWRFAKERAEMQIRMAGKDVSANQKTAWRYDLNEALFTRYIIEKVLNERINNGTINKEV